MWRNNVINILELLLCLTVWVECVKKPFIIHIGGILDDEVQEKTLKKSLDKGTNLKFRFEPRVVHPVAKDSYTLINKVCASTSSDDDGEWAAVVDAGEVPGSCDALCQLCHKVQIPQLSTSWRPPEPSATSTGLFGLAYYPQPMLVSRAYSTLIKHLGWKDFTLLYEDDGGLIRLQEILKSRPAKAPPVTVRRLDPLGDNRRLFKDLKSEGFFVVDCSVSNIKHYLEHIVDVNNATMYQKYIFTSLDTHTVDFKLVPKFEGAVFTLHMTNRDEPFWIEVGGEDSNSVQLKTALVADAAKHIANAIQKFDKSAFAVLAPICQKKRNEAYTPWENGTVLLDVLKNNAFDGLTGRVYFGNSSYRQNVELKYSNFTSKGFVQQGYWNSSTDILTITNTGKGHQLFDMDSTRKIRVVSRIGKPYFGLTNDTESEEKYEGFAVDLIKAIFDRIRKTDGITYVPEFYPARSSNYQDLIDDLIKHAADLAICDLTMTSKRQAVVDFSAPFMSLGISILFVKPEKEEPDKFSFMQPLAVDLWLYLGTAYILVSFVLLICARMSQKDWVNPHPCNRNPEALENIWNLYNCTWLSMGTIMTQGCDILPRAAGSRWVTGMWWFFALIVTASYTANMSSFISNKRRDNDIQSVKDLAQEKTIQYGTIYGQSTYQFFKYSNDSVYKKIFSVMESARPSVYTDNNDKGKERVSNGKSNKYAFFMESTAIEYYVQRDCKLKMIGGRLDSKEYGIAMPKRSPLRSMIDAAVLTLQEEAEIERIKKVWWVEKDNTVNCTEKLLEEEAEAKGGDSLQMKNTSGIFLVLLAGGILGLMFASVDFVLHAHKIATTENVTWKEAFLSEWRSSLNPRVLSKPVAPPRSAAPSPTSTGSADARRSTSRAVSVLRAAQSFINLDKVY